MQIKRFLELCGEFVNTHIDNEDDNAENILDVEESEEESDANKRLKNSLTRKDIVQLKSNHIPIGLIPLEKLFDQNDVDIDQKMKPPDDAMEEKNIGTEENPRIIKLSKKLTSRVKEEYINPMKRYIYVFSWSYEDLKEYDTSIIQHRIPIKLG